jgi:signal transduction histidine kinase
MPLYDLSRMARSALRRTPSATLAREDPRGMNALPNEPRLMHIPERLQRVSNVALALAITVATTAGLAAWNHGRGPHHHSAPAAAFVVVGLAGISLAWRRRYPRLVLAAVVVAVFVNCLIFDSPRVTTVALFVALVSVATRRPLAETLVGAGIAFLAIVLGSLIGGRAITWELVGSSFVSVAALTAISLLIGTRRAYYHQLRARARDLERERELLAERAVADERVRIARELHDAVAHHVSLLVVQAGAIRESLPRDAPQRGVADSMAATGRQALGEMRNMLGLLRTGDGAPEREPQPGVADIRTLLDQTRAAGVDVDLTIQGDERELPVGVDLSAYRIVQESLTNVVRHAGPAHASVVLRYQPDALELTVTDDGKATNGDGGGHGIVGMRERAALFGGELFAGPATGGGWRVHAVLPLGEPR